MPSENVETSNPSAEPADLAAGGDRRTRKREARRDHLLDLAADLVERDGVDGVTMAALAEAADYAPASLYTYFASRSALLAALQERALVVLGGVGERHLAATAAAVAADSDLPADVAALARLCAFSDLFLAAPVRHAREFRLQQQLLVTPGAEEAVDAGRLVPVAFHVLDAPRRHLVEAAEAGALHDGTVVADPLGAPLEPAVARTLAWVVALNGALLADGLVTGLPTTGAGLGDQLTDALLVGWGAAPDLLARARAVVAGWPDDAESGRSVR